MPSKEELKEEIRTLKICEKIREKQCRELGRKQADQWLELEKYRNWFKTLKEILKEV